jgi:hypothetical protein
MLDLRVSRSIVYFQTNFAQLKGENQDRIGTNFRCWCHIFVRDVSFLT